MAATHAVVNFFIDNSVAVVPIEWMADDQKSCYFPPSTFKGLNKAVRKSHNYEPEWVQYQCRVFRCYQNYNDARMDLPNAQVTSDLSGAEGGKQKTAKALIPKLPAHPSTVSDGASGSSTEAGVHNNLIGADEISVEKETVVQLEEEVGFQGFEASSQILHVTCSSDCKAFQETVLLKLQGIEDVQKTQCELMNSILNALSMNNSTETGPKYEFASGTFPVTSVSALEALEVLIRENDLAKTSLKTKLKGYSGDNLANALKMRFKFSITDDVLAEHSLKGQSKKLAFSAYKSLVESIFESFQETIKFKTTTMDEFETAITTNLKWASDRVSQRIKKAALASSKRALQTKVTSQ